MYKYQVNTYPFNVVFPPYTDHKKSIVRLFLKYLGANQSVHLKRFIIAMIFLWVFWLVVTKRITLKKLQNAKNILKVALSMTFKM